MIYIYPRYLINVDHVILYKKHRSMDVPSVDWFSSYLSDRKQIVDINEVVSNPLGVYCGVPQGDVLSRRLFLCDVNDVVISVDCKLLLYAEDSALLVSDKNPGHIAERLGKEHISCRQWLIDNKLLLLKKVNLNERTSFPTQNSLENGKLFLSHSLIYSVSLCIEQLIPRVFICSCTGCMVPFPT